MRVLLDTHTLLWAFLDSPNLSPKARSALANPENELVISAASAMEITLKHRIGKLDEAAPFIQNGLLDLSGLSYAPLAITLDHASRAGSLDIPHKDPFDRMLIAQAQIENVPLLSNHKLFDSFGVKRIW